MTTPQALAGLVAQLRSGQSLQIWEHGVLMRERLIYLDCFKRNLLPHFVNEQLTRFHRLAGQVRRVCRVCYNLLALI